MNIGNKIKELRKKRNLTQVELAKLVGCAQNTIAEWESLRNRQPRGKHLEDLAKALGVSLNYLITSSDQDEKNIPCYGEITDNEFVLKKAPIYNIKLPSHTFKNNSFALKMIDNSLSPLAEKEDYCIFEPKFPIDNDIVVMGQKMSYIKVWRQNEKIAAASNFKIDSEPTIFINLEKTLTTVEYKEQVSQEKIYIRGVLIAVKKTLKVFEVYPRIKYIFS